MQSKEVMAWKVLRSILGEAQDVLMELAHLCEV